MDFLSPSPNVLDNGQFDISFQAMGTNCEISFCANSQEQAINFRQNSLSWVRNFENRYSRYLPSSLISQINQFAGIKPVKIDHEDLELFKLCDTLHFLTKGSFDPTTLPLTKIWDFKFKFPKIPSKSSIDSAMSKIGWKKVILEEDSIFLPDHGMCLDFGGFGKEFAVDKIIDTAKQYEIKSIMVNLGGDIRTLGSPVDCDKWNIGIEDPNLKGQARFCVSFNDMSVATSGNYQRYFELNGIKYGHILNHTTGYPTKSTYLSASVISKTCIVAGVLSTCSLLDGNSSGLKIIEDFFGAEGCLWSKSGICWTKNFSSYVQKN